MKTKQPIMNEKEIDNSSENNSHPFLLVLLEVEIGKYF